MKKGGQAGEKAQAITYYFLNYFCNPLYLYILKIDMMTGSMCRMAILLINMVIGSSWLEPTGLVLTAGRECFWILFIVDIIAAIELVADKGINVVRIPIATDLLYAWSQGIYPPLTDTSYNNPALAGLIALSYSISCWKILKR